MAELAGFAYAKTFSPKNIFSGFKSSGIYPFNPDVFHEAMFLPASVTDIPVAAPACHDARADISSELCSSTASSTETDETLLCIICPHAETVSKPTARATK